MEFGGVPTGRGTRAAMATISTVSGLWLAGGCVTVIGAALLMRRTVAPLCVKLPTDKSASIAKAALRARSAHAQSGPMATRRIASGAGVVLSSGLELEVQIELSL